MQKIPLAKYLTYDYIIFFISLFLDKTELYYGIILDQFQDSIIYQIVLADILYSQFLLMKLVWRAPSVQCARFIDFKHLH